MSKEEEYNKRFLEYLKNNKKILEITQSREKIRQQLRENFTTDEIADLCEFMQKLECLDMNCDNCDLSAIVKERNLMFS